LRIVRRHCRRGDRPASASADTLKGAGSTLVAPLERDWAAGFATATGDSVQYPDVGSGAGVADISAGIVDFGASDPPLTAAQAVLCRSSTRSAEVTQARLRVSVLECCSSSAFAVRDRG